MPGERGSLIAGRYRLGAPVGQDATGLVWRARDTLLDRDVAVKQIPLPAKSPGQLADVGAAIIREVKAAARLDQPAVIAIHDVADQDGSLWIVTQVTGQSPETENTPAGPEPAGPEPAKAPADQPPAPARRPGETLTPRARANPRLLVGVVIAIVMVAALILVITLFPSSHKKDQSPGVHPTSPSATSTR